MKTDSLFYQIFHTLPGTLFELIGESADIAQDYQFASVEIKQPNFRIDGVFRPAVDSAEKLIYFVEVQFQKDEGFYRRLFAEIFLYLEQEKPAANWRAVVLFPGPSIDPGLPHQYEALRSNHLTALYLNALKPGKMLSPGIKMVHLIVAPPKKAVEVGKNLLKKLREEPGDANLNRETIDLVETILLYKFSAISREEFEAMFQLDDLKQTRIYQEALQEGKQEGEMIGREEGKLDMVPLLLQSGLSIERIAQESGLDIEAVRSAALGGANGADGNGHAA